MNEFEKWWDIYSYWAELNETGVAKETARDAYEQGKKDVLRWVLKEREAWGESGYDCIFDMIKEELNE